MFTVVSLCYDTESVPFLLDSYTYRFYLIRSLSSVLSICRDRLLDFHSHCKISFMGQPCIRHFLFSDLILHCTLGSPLLAHLQRRSSLKEILYRNRNPLSFDKM